MGPGRGYRFPWASSPLAHRSTSIAAVGARFCLFEVQATLALSAVACGRTCVQVAFLDDGIVALRNSKNVDPVPPHLFTDTEYDVFVAGILRGELVQGAHRVSGLLMRISLHAAVRDGRGLAVPGAGGLRATRRACLLIRPG